MNSNDPSDLEAVLNAGKLIGGMHADIHTSPNGTPYILLPSVSANGQTIVRPHLMERVMLTPARVRALVSLRTPQSFVAYVQRFADAGSVIFANSKTRSVVAVLDYHESATAARWGAHRAVLTCQLTEDWTRWTAADHKKMSQIEFAQFLEDNLQNIAEPDGSTILNVARQLEAHKSSQFKSSIRLDNGELQLTYEETITGTAQKGAVQIPTDFTLGIKPFEGGEAYAVKARFRYRIDNGLLSLWFDLLRPDAVLEDAFNRVLETVAAGVKNPDVPILAADPPADVSIGLSDPWK